MMDGKSKDKETLDIISKLAPIGGFVATAITVYSDLPILLRYIIIVLMALITVVSIYAVSGQPLIKFIKKKATAIKHRLLTRKYYKNFNVLVDRFRDLINEDHRDTIPFILRQIENSNPKYVNILPHPQDFKSAVDTCRWAIGKLPVTKDNFLILLGWFESVMNLCNELLIRKPIEEIRRRGVDEIREDIMEDYERCRALYHRFLDDYMDFAKEMNNQFGEKVARDYFEVPKGLRK